MSQGPWAVKIADIFQVSGGSRALGRIEVTSLCGLTAGPFMTGWERAPSQCRGYERLFPKNRLIESVTDRDSSD